MITAHISPPPIEWETLGKDIYAIETAIFGSKAFSESFLQTDLSNHDVVVAILKDGDKVIGFAYALPEDEETVCVADIAISAEYQNRGLVATIMSCLETALKQKGYLYMTEHAMVENGYAAKIKKHYNARIIETSDFVGEYGKQTYFKIHL